MITGDQVAAVLAAVFSAAQVAELIQIQK